MASPPWDNATPPGEEKSSGRYISWLLPGEEAILPKWLDLKLIDFD